MRGNPKKSDVGTAGRLSDVSQDFIRVFDGRPSSSSLRAVSMDD
jgi:hypothetical protein